MALSTIEERVADVRAFFQAGLAAVDAGAAVRRHLRLEGSVLCADGWRYRLGGGRIHVLGGGKAAAAMGAALEGILGERVTRGLLVVKDGHGAPAGSIPVREAGHPVPDRRGQAAAGGIMAIARSASEGDLVVVLLSGGASALLALPAEGVSLEDKRAVTEHLLRSGATIGELNAVRKHLSAIKGGRLAQAAAPAEVMALILSDVAGDRLDVIASGPTAPDPTTFSEALAVLARHDPEERLPPGPRAHLAEGAAGRHPETLEPGDPLLDRVHNVIIGSNRDALDAAASAARARGYEVLLKPGALAGEARETAAAVARDARRIAGARASGSPPLALILGGETTVTVRGNGRGGRNTEFALAFARDIDGSPGAVALFAGTDGTDGPTDAAGAIVTGRTVASAASKGLDPEAFLDENDSYTFFQKAGGLVITGPTMTNVMDLGLVLLG